MYSSSCTVLLYYRRCSGCNGLCFLISCNLSYFVKPLEQFTILVIRQLTKFVFEKTTLVKKDWRMRTKNLGLCVYQLKVIMRLNRRLKFVYLYSRYKYITQCILYNVAIYILYIYKLGEENGSHQNRISLYLIYMFYTLGTRHYTV